MADPVFPTRRADPVQAPFYKNYANNWQYQQIGGYVVGFVGNGAARPLPVATGATLVVQTASGVKNGSPPLMPAPRPDGTFLVVDEDTGETIDCTFLNGTITNPLPTLISQNPPQYQFAVGCRYEYLLNGLVGAATGVPGGSYPADSPVLTQAQAAVPGAATTPAVDLEVPPDVMRAGGYDWPFTTICASFFDPNLSYRGGPAAG